MRTTNNRSRLSVTRSASQPKHRQRTPLPTRRARDSSGSSRILGQLYQRIAAAEILLNCLVWFWIARRTTEARTGCRSARRACCCWTEPTWPAATSRKPGLAPPPPLAATRFAVMPLRAESARRCDVSGDILHLLRLTSYLLLALVSCHLIVSIVLHVCQHLGLLQFWKKIRIWW